MVVAWLIGCRQRRALVTVLSADLEAQFLGWIEHRDLATSEEGESAAHVTERHLLRSRDQQEHTVALYLMSLGELDVTRGRVLHHGQGGAGVPRLSERWLNSPVCIRIWNVLFYTRY